MTKKQVSFEQAQNGEEYTSVNPSTLPVIKDPLSKDDDRFELIRRIREDTLPLLPSECFIKNEYSGMLATDLFCLNTLLGSMIESKVVDFLNTHRKKWDPNEELNEYHFVRSSETFPDVRLVKGNDDLTPKLGIELKSWFILSKEQEPSFRYTTAAEACDDSDSLCIVPWYLSNAVCGNPVLMKPWVYSAKQAAWEEKQFWEYKKESKLPMTLEARKVDVPKDAKPYMNARSKTNYSVHKDKGNNFGRLARSEIMDDFINEILKTEVLGIPAENWCKFLQIHTDSKKIKNMEQRIKSIVNSPKTDEFVKKVNELKILLETI